MAFPVWEFIVKNGPADTPSNPKPDFFQVRQQEPKALARSISIGIQGRGTLWSLGDPVAIARGTARRTSPPSSRN